MSATRRRDIAGEVVVRYIQAVHPAGRDVYLRRLELRHAAEPLLQIERDKKLGDRPGKRAERRLFPRSGSGVGAGRREAALVARGPRGDSGLTTHNESAQRVPEGHQLTRRRLRALRGRPLRKALQLLLRLLALRSTHRRLFGGGDE